jgi:hypothetical protein
MNPERDKIQWRSRMGWGLMAKGRTFPSGTPEVVSGNSCMGALNPLHKGNACSGVIIPHGRGDNFLGDTPPDPREAKALSKARTLLRLKTGNFH